MHVSMTAVALAALFATAVPAIACRAVPQPHDPARVASNIVLLATVTNAYRLAGSDWAYDLTVDRVLQGSYPAQRHELRWTPGGDGRCPARGPLLSVREQVVIYLDRSARGEPFEQGWMPLADARVRDPRWAIRR